MNIANCLTKNAGLFPNRIAVEAPKYRGKIKYDSLTFKELEELSNSYANGLSEIGLKKGDKALLFVKPCLDFSALTFALYKVGAVPVFIDPGMGKDNLLNSIKQIKPKALIGIPKVHIAKWLYKEFFKTIDIQVTTGSFKLGSMKNLRDIKKGKVFTCVETSPEDMAAILFTSGGTGIPKGVSYTHKIFNAQLRLLEEMFTLTPDDIDMPGFPLFSLFTVGIGMKSVIPLMDAAKPSSVNPKYLVNQIHDKKVTFAAGSPAIWEKVADYCLEKNITLPSVKRLVMFGAPVSVELHRKFSKVLTGGTTYTPYGATESLPVSNISGKEILGHMGKLTEQGLGTCVGRVVPSVTVKIVEISDNVLKDIKEVAPGIVGEIIVSGDIVTKSYQDMPEQTMMAKIYDGDKIWHRIGDLGYFDEKGYLWFCGRKTHRVNNLYPSQCEAIFNTHHDVKRTALIGPNNKPAIVVQRQDGKILKGIERERFERELKELGDKFSHTKQIESFYHRKDFPVDVRHNIKIDRLALRDEAQRNVL
jgi:acyl-CoA synthetase (AMP-forming)/AMP-acid ligase II